MKNSNCFLWPVSSQKDVRKSIDSHMATVAAISGELACGLDIADVKRALELLEAPNGGEEAQELRGYLQKMAKVVE